MRKRFNPAVLFSTDSKYKEYCIAHRAENSLPCVSSKRPRTREEKIKNIETKLFGTDEEFRAKIEAYRKAHPEETNI